MEAEFCVTCSQRERMVTCEGGHLEVPIPGLTQAELDRIREEHRTGEEV